MSNPAYIAANLIDIDTIITSSTEDASYTLGNLITENMALPFRFTSDTGGYIEFDLLTARTFNSIAIMNLPEASSIVIKAGASPNPSTTVGTPTWQQGGVWADLGSQLARYVRVTITFVSTDTPQVGFIMLNLRTEITPYSYRFGYEAGEDEQNLERTTERGIPWVFNLYNADILNTTWRVLTDELELLRSMHRAVGGRAHPFIFIPDTDLPAVLYCRKQAGFRYTNVDGSTELFDYTMPLTGESFGVDIFT